MAISVTRPTHHKAGFFANGVTADASGCEELVPGVAGKSIVLDHLRVSSDAALTVTIGEGESVPWDFRNGGMKLTEGSRSWWTAAPQEMSTCSWRAELSDEIPPGV